MRASMSDEHNADAQIVQGSNRTREEVEYFVHRQLRVPELCTRPCESCPCPDPHGACM